MKKTILQAIILLALIILSTFIAMPIARSPTQQQPIVNIYTDKPIYKQGELVTIFGTVTDINGQPVQDAAVAIEVKNPNDITIFLDVVYTTEYGTYEDSFRLATQEPNGQYTIYINCLTTQTQSYFWVSSQKVTITYKDYEIQLQPDNTVQAQITITMRSPTLQSILVSTHLTLLDPTGNPAYDNFQGIGGPKDLKRTTIYNNTETTITFTFQLTEPKIGIYTYSISICSYDTANTFETTGWNYAFTYEPPPEEEINLGSIPSNYTIIDTPDIILDRLESIKYTFYLTEDCTYIHLIPTATSHSRLTCILKTDQTERQYDLNFQYHTYPTWLIHNAPAGQYELIITATSDYAWLYQIEIQTGEKITQPTIRIIEATPTSKFATPEGTMNYHVKVQWNITQTDNVTITATLQGQIQDKTNCTAEILQDNIGEFYLKVTAPSTTGTYTVTFTAKLTKAGKTDTTTAQLNVQYNPYNITLAPYIRYYKLSKTASFFGGYPQYVRSPQQLQALEVTDIKISAIDETDETGKPTKISISFKARNKYQFLTKKSVHYVVSIKIGTNTYPLAILIAGDPTRTIEAHNIPVTNNKVTFTILYQLWSDGVVIELAGSLLKTAFSLVLSSAGAELLSILTDFVRITIIYYWQIAVECNNGYMNAEEGIRLLEDLGFNINDFLDNFLEAIKVTGNTFFSIQSTLKHLKTTGKANSLQYVVALLRLYLHVFYKAYPKFVETIVQAAEKAAVKLMIYGLIKDFIPKLWEKLGREEFYKNLGKIFNFAELGWVLLSLLLAPAEEGKEILYAQIGQGSAADVDPIVSIDFEGPTQNTNITYFGDVKQLEIDINKTHAQLIYTIDKNITAAFIPIFSDEGYRENIFSTYGFNATKTTLTTQNQTETTIFVLNAEGNTYPGINRINFKMNETWTKGYQQISAEAITINGTTWLNATINYPFSKNLSYTINITIPTECQIIQVLSDGTPTIENNTITWNTPIDWFAIQLTTPPTDIAITNISLSNPNPTINETITISVTVTNLGNYTKTFDVSVNYTRLRDPTLGTQTITLAPDESATLNFTWTPNITGRYQILAYTGQMPEDVDPSNNSLKIIIYVRPETTDSAGGTSFRKRFLR